MASNPLQEAVRAAAEDLKRKLLEQEVSEVPAPPPAQPSQVEEAIADLLGAPAPEPPRPEPPPHPPPPAPASVPAPPSTPEDLDRLIQSEFSRPPEPELPGPEDRQALESALGIAAPAPVLAPPPRASAAPDDLESLIQSEMSKPAEPAAPSRPAIPTPPPSVPRVKPSFSPPPPAVVTASLPEPPSKAGMLAARCLGFLWTGLIGVLNMADSALPAPLKARKTLLGRVGIAATLAAMLGLGFWICMRVGRG